MRPSRIIMRFGINYKSLCMANGNVSFIQEMGEE